MSAFPPWWKVLLGSVGVGGQNCLGCSAKSLLLSPPSRPVACHGLPSTPGAVIRLLPFLFPPLGSSWTACSLALTTSQPQESSRCWQESVAGVPGLAEGTVGSVDWAKPMIPALQGPASGSWCLRGFGEWWFGENWGAAGGFRSGLSWQGREEDLVLLCEGSYDVGLKCVENPCPSPGLLNAV